MKNNNLSCLQARIGGKTSSGRNTALYVSNETEEKIHFRINGEDIFVEIVDILNCLITLQKNVLGEQNEQMDL